MGRGGRTMAIDVRVLLEGLKARTERLFKDSHATGRFLDQASAKLGSHREIFTAITGDIETLLRLVRACINGRYPEIPWRTLLWAGAALIYFVSPLDLIPDFILGTGLLDDLAVLTYVLALLKTELSEFRDWEAAQAADLDE